MGHMEVNKLIKTIASILSIVLSIASLIISIISLIVSLAKKIKRFSFENIEINDDYELLFSTADTGPRNIIKALCANYNNRDVLLHLKSGYFAVWNTRLKKYEIHEVKEDFFTLKANQRTELQIKIKPYKTDRIKDRKKRAHLVFEYHNGCRLKRFRYSEKKKPFVASS